MDNEEFEKALHDRLEESDELKCLAEQLVRLYYFHCDEVMNTHFETYVKTTMEEVSLVMSNMRKIVEL